MLTHCLTLSRKWLLQHIFPAYCVNCGALSDQSYDLCSHCEQAMPIIIRPCVQCGLTLAGQSTLTDHCGQCLRNAPKFYKIYALFAYEEPIRTFISAFKFHHQLHYARLFSTLLGNRITQQWYVGETLPQLIIPMPLHPERMRTRGYNQALEMAQPLAKLLQLPIRHPCQRQKPTRAQTELSAQQRASNVRRAFVLKQPVGVQHVAILDDVVTTGHTINALCRALNPHGDKRIDVWCCARTPR